MNALERRIRASLLAIDGVVESASAFNDGDAFWVNGKEIAHLTNSATVDLRLTRNVISAKRGQLTNDPRVRMRKNGGDWLEVSFASQADVVFVLELAELAVAAHRAPVGATAKPPPEGADLARRRRFH